MATTYGMTSMGMTTSPMMSANMNLPLSTARPIEVTETTANLEEIQNFPVAGRAADGTHFHQDPVSGQMYRMSAELHDRIPEILRNRMIMVTQTISSTPSVISMGGVVTSQPTISNVITNKTTSTTNTTNRNINLNSIMDFINPVNNSSEFLVSSKNVMNRYTDITISDYDTKTSRSNITTQIDYKKPINRILNLSIGNYLIDSPNSFIPINKFMNLSYSYGSNSGVYGNNYIPINRFF